MERVSEEIDHKELEELFDSVAEIPLEPEHLALEGLHSASTMVSPVLQQLKTLEGAAPEAIFKDNGRSKRSTFAAGDSEDPTKLYLSDIGRYKLLTPEGEQFLARRIKLGDTAAEVLELDKQQHDLTTRERRELKKLVRQAEEDATTFLNSNLRLVVSIAKKYQASGLPLLDLIQEGNLGLLHALKKFEPTRGFKFSTYATWWIRQAITRGIANQGRVIRLPVHASDTLLNIQKARSRHMSETGRMPTEEELAEELEMNPDRFAEIARHASEPVSLETPVGDKGTTELKDIVEDRTAEDPFSVALRNMYPDAVEAAMKILDERERRVLTLRFGLDKGEVRSNEEVGELIGVNRERVRQIEARALAKLRHPSSSAKLQDILG